MQPHNPTSEQTLPVLRDAKGWRFSNTASFKALTLHYGVVQYSTDEIIKYLQNTLGQHLDKARRARALQDQICTLLHNLPQSSTNLEFLNGAGRP